MKKDIVIFWITTGLIFLFEGVLTAITADTEMAKESFRHLGYPQYFGVMLNVFKVLGACALIIPKVPHRIKEWAYAGFGIDFIAAFVSDLYVEGTFPIAPLIAFAILTVSYIYYHKTYALIEFNTKGKTNHG
ncbi:DoxX family protein [Aquimarina sp. AU119]|uniref:DoxX family protein n=1 Tax=Aquimarina sp. AU119 TaxID=2108528 RepID=UPI000D68B75A|nr:DoxX family protein [Aquimarina sp. AU119]